MREMAIGSSVKYSMDTSTALFPLGDNDAALRILSSTGPECMIAASAVFPINYPERGILPQSHNDPKIF